MSGSANVGMGRSSRARTILYLPHHDQSQRLPGCSSGPRPSSFDDWLQAFREQASFFTGVSFGQGRSGTGAARRAGRWPTCCRCCRSSARPWASRPGWCLPSCARIEGPGWLAAVLAVGAAVLITRRAARRRSGRHRRRARAACAGTGAAAGDHARQPQRHLRRAGAGALGRWSRSRASPSSPAPPAWSC